MGGHAASVKKRFLLDFVWVWARTLKKSDHLQDIDVDERAILNLSSRNKLRWLWDVVWIDLAQDRDTWLVFVIAVMKIRVAYNAGNCLIS